jgi:hypothetical protein
MLLKHRKFTALIEFVGHSEHTCIFRTPGSDSSNGFFSLSPEQVRSDWIPLHTLKLREKSEVSTEQQ